MIKDLFLIVRKIVLNGMTQAPHPFGIAVFENHVFFTDWTKMGVMRANRFNGSNPSLLYRTASRPGHVVVSHPVLQPFGKEMNLYSSFHGTLWIYSVSVTKFKITTIFLLYFVIYHVNFVMSCTSTPIVLCAVVIKVWQK